MEEKKPWWKKILEKIGIIKEDVPRLENRPLVEPLKRDVDFNEDKKDDFNESLKVEIKPKELTKEDIVFEVLKEKGIDSKLLENPRFKEDIMKQVETMSQIDNPEGELTVERAKRLAQMYLIADKNGVAYQRDDKQEGILSRNIVRYSLEGDNYVKYDSYNSVPLREGGEAVVNNIKKTYNKDGIEMERKISRSSHEEYNYNTGDIYGNIGSKRESLTMRRQGVDSMYCAYQKDGVTPYNMGEIGFTMTIDNRYPDTLYVSKTILQPLYAAKNIEEATKARDALTQGELFYDDDRKADLKAYQERTARGIKNSKYSKALTEMANKQPEYAKLLEPDKDM